jgi:uncharacterized repeat protein (TIGR01451 family)/LPXTG-motif cell wall-anchored protein
MRLSDKCEIERIGYIMIKHKKMKHISLLAILLIVVMMGVPAISTAAPLPTKVDLLTTSNFAVLAGAGITDGGGFTIINGDAGGDVGLSPTAGTAITGLLPLNVSGTIYAVDSTGPAGLSGNDPAKVNQAQTDLVTAYNEAASRTTNTTIVAALGGGETLLRGTYTSATSIQINGDLTLDAQGDPDAVFVFQAGSTLTTASNSKIILANGARYCRIFWQVGSSATLGTDSKFVGHIFALTSITANSGATVQGQLLARNGAVTLDNNTITNGFCAAPATLKVIKHVINDDGGTAVAANFNLYVKTAGGAIIAGPVAGSEAGTSYTLVAGTYIVSEDVNPGYNAIYSGGDIPGSGSITLTPGVTATVTITNNDIHYSSGGGSSPVNPPLINIIKTPQPLALTSGQGSVTYTYKVSNPGKVTLSNVRVTDDKVSPVNYVSGDLNADNLLQINETWIYTATMNLNATTTNTATAKGSANGMTATDIAMATVVVTTAAPVYPPLINVVKTPDPLALTAGPGSVTYTYKVTNPGMVPLSNVTVTDDKVSPVNYVSGDLNADRLLQSNETWIYTATMKLNATTTNTATAKGSANGMTAMDIAFATVVVTQPAIVTQTVNGGQLPKTSTSLYELLFIGVALILVGAVLLKNRKRYE